MQGGENMTVIQLQAHVGVSGPFSFFMPALSGKPCQHSVIYSDILMWFFESELPSVSFIF